MNKVFKTKVLIFSGQQFGYLVDTFKYCEYVGEEFEITYLGWDYKRPKHSLQGIHVKYVSRHGNLFRRNYRLLRALHKELKSNIYEIIFLNYIRGISFIRFLHLRKKMIFDVRTLSISHNRFDRWIYDSFLKFESLFFKNYSVISDGIANKLRLKKYNLLPLGADPILNKSRKRGIPNQIRLLYIGTLQGRDILKCVKGMEKYIDSSGDENVLMKIIGDGPELSEIENYVKNSSILKDKVECTGRVLHTELKPYFEWANVGVSFVPITPWYNFQPPTKTFEYLLSGLPVIATSTNEHINLLQDEKYCVLINDDSKSFSKGIEEMNQKLKGGIEREYFQKKYADHNWETIVKNNFLGILKSAK